MLSQNETLRIRLDGMLCSPSTGSPQFRRNKKAIVTTLFILGSYLIGWMPAVISFMLVCDKDCLISRDTLDFNSIYTVLVFWSFNMLIVIKTLANSFIYTSRMKEIKVEIYIELVLPPQNQP